MKRLVLGLVLATAATTPAAACFEPREPFCLQIGRPDHACEADIRRYLKDEDEFRACVAQKAERDMADSVARAKKVIDRWNCRVAGQPLCL